MNAWVIERNWIHTYIYAFHSSSWTSWTLRQFPFAKCMRTIDGRPVVRFEKKKWQWIESGQALKCQRIVWRNLFNSSRLNVDDFASVSKFGNAAIPSPLTWEAIHRRESNPCVGVYNVILSLQGWSVGCVGLIWFGSAVALFGRHRHGNHAVLQGMYVLSALRYLSTLPRFFCFVSSWL